MDSMRPWCGHGPPWCGQHAMKKSTELGNGGSGPPSATTDPPGHHLLGLDGIGSAGNSKWLVRLYKDQPILMLSGIQIQGENNQRRRVGRSARGEVGSGAGGGGVGWGGGGTEVSQCWGSGTTPETSL